jgi:hypothetical protein
MGEHYVPRKYLSYFADPAKPSHVWMYDKKTEKWSHAALTKVAQQSDFYRLGSNWRRLVTQKTGLPIFEQELMDIKTFGMPNI